MSLELEKVIAETEVAFTKCKKLEKEAAATHLKCVANRQTTEEILTLLKKAKDGSTTSLFKALMIMQAKNGRERVALT